eukprot:COSAG02_NODE_8624_length_2501_cov_100.993846_2_plen_84_part_00
MRADHFRDNIRGDTVQAPADIAERFRAQNFNLVGGVQHIKQGFVIVTSRYLLFEETVSGNGEPTEVQRCQQRPRNGPLVQAAR